MCLEEHVLYVSRAPPASLGTCVSVPLALRRQYGEKKMSYCSEKKNVFFKDMRRRGIKADVLTYNALITALGNGGKKERALQV